MAPPPPTIPPPSPIILAPVPINTASASTVNTAREAPEKPYGSGHTTMVNGAVTGSTILKLIQAFSVTLLAHQFPCSLLCLAQPTPHMTNDASSCEKEVAGKV